jgi:hypothetical protein
MTVQASGDNLSSIHQNHDAAGLGLTEANTPMPGWEYLNLHLSAPTSENSSPVLMRADPAELKPPGLALGATADEVFRAMRDSGWEFTEWEGFADWKFDGSSGTSTPIGGETLYVLRRRTSA